MFKNEKGDWAIRKSSESVAILHRAYIIDPSKGNKYTSAGTSTGISLQACLSLLIGNKIEINYKRNGEDLKLSIKPAKLLITESSHIFMNNQIA